MVIGIIRKTYQQWKTVLEDHDVKKELIIWLIRVVAAALLGALSAAAVQEAVALSVADQPVVAGALAAVFSGSSWNNR